MDFDLKRYLTEDMGFDEAAADAMLPNFTPERVAKVAERYATPQQKQALAGLETAQANLQAAEQRLNGEIAEWSTMTAAEKANNEQMRNDLESAQRKVFDLQQKATRLAEQAGVDPKTVIGEPVVEPKKEVVAAPVDTSKFIDRETFGNIASFQMELPATLQFIADQHFDLTGTRLDTRDIVKEIRARVGKAGADVDPIHVWEEKYDIAAKRQAKSDAALKQQLKDADDKGYERGRSEASIPSPSMPGRSAPVFTMKDNGQPRTSRLSRPQPETTVTAAAQALRSGKYRTAAR